MRVLVYTGVQARPQADDFLHAVGRKERITVDFIRLLTDTVHTPRTLDKADDCPRQVEVHDDMGILQVLPLAEHVGGYEHTVLLIGEIILVVALGREMLHDVRRVLAASRRTADLRYSTPFQLPVNVMCRVGELCEHDNLVRSVLLLQQIFQFVQFRVGIGLPCTAQCYHP